MRLTRCVLAVAVWAASAAGASPQTPAVAAAPLTFADLERMALEKNPTLAQGTAQVEAAKGRARQASLFSNPTIGYTGDEISGGPTIRGGEHGFFVEQTFPLGGKLRLARAVFEREAGQAEALRDAQRLRVLNAVRVLFYEGLAAQQRVEVRERLARLSAEAVTVSQQLMNVGQADRPDLLEAEIEAQQAQLALMSARNEQDQTWQRLAAAVADPGLPPRPLAGSLEEAVPPIDRDRALETIVRDSPELKAARAGIERAEAALARERREPVPDLFVRGGPRYNRELLERGARPVGWEGSVDAGVSLPLFNRNQGNIAAAAADLTRAREEVRRVELSLRTRFAVVFDRYLTARRTAETYHAEIIPRAQEAYALFLQKYRQMGAAYPQVLIAQRTLFQTSEAYVSALEEVWRSAVEIQGLLLTDGLEAPPAAGEPAARGTRRRIRSW